MTLEDLLRSHEIQGLALRGLGVISRLTKTTADDTAVEVLAAVRGVLGVISAGAEGKVTVQEARDALDSLTVRIAAADAAADARAAAKPRRPDGTP